MKPAGVQGPEQGLKKAGVERVMMRRRTKKMEKHSGFKNVSASLKKAEVKRV